MRGVPEVQLINSFPPPTAVWKYARLAKLALGVKARLATIRVGNFNFDRVDPAESEVFGINILSPRISSLLNFAFAEVSLRGVTEECEQVQRAGGTILYLAEDIRPWFADGKLGVVIHGNPRATIESDKFYNFSLGYRIAVGRNLRAFSRVATALVQSNYVRRGLEESGYGGPIRVIPPAIDPIFWRPVDRSAARRRFNLPTNRRLVFSISTGERRKNLQILPQVLDRLNSQFSLVRVGPPVRGAIAMRNLSDLDVAELYAACDVLLFPTFEEGFGYPAIEAFASGLPVVTSDIEIMREVCGDAALLADPSDPEALARCCEEATSNPEELVARGQRRAREFSIENLALGLSTFLERLETRA